MSSSDDDDLDDAMRAGRGRNRRRNQLPRFQYPTFGNDGDGDDAGEEDEDNLDGSSSDDATGGQSRWRQQQRRTTARGGTGSRRNRNQNLDSSDDDDEEGYRHHRRTKKKKRRTTYDDDRGRQQQKPAPLFVKGDVYDPTEAKDEEEDEKVVDGDKKEKAIDDEVDDKAQSSSIHTKDATAADGSSPPEEDDDNDDEDVEFRKKQVEADQRFLSLLDRGRRRTAKQNTKKSRSPIPAAAAERATMGGSNGAGLGFSAATTTSDSNIPASDNHASSMLPSSGAGLGFSRAQQMTGSSSSSPPTMGLGMHRETETITDNDNSAATSSAAAFAGLGMPAQFGRPIMSHDGLDASGGASTTSSARRKRGGVGGRERKDPNLGKWEKHTKGIGMKLLTKMGYKGTGGLGSKRRVADGKIGISRAVEVVVRPNNLGLGFGSFKEATRLKVNQQIEAQVRGVEQADDDDKKKHGTDGMDDEMDVGSGAISALPSVTDMMKDQSWKRGAKQRSKKRARKREVIPYAELLQKQNESPAVVIDMRGPSAAAASQHDEVDDGATKEVPLAEELMHNISLLLNTYENRTHSSSHYCRSTRQKLASISSDMDGMKQRIQERKDRAEKVDKSLQIINQIEALSLAVGSNNETDKMKKLSQLIERLGDNFSAEERAALKFSQVLIPSLLGGVVQGQIDNWNPLAADPTSSDQMIRSTLSLASTIGGTDEEEQAARKMLLRKYLLPKIHSCLESSRWDPMRDVEPALRLYELILRLVNEVAPPASENSTVDDDAHVFPTEREDERASLADAVKEAIINNTVYNKLSRSLNQWQPLLDENGMLENRPDLWILPWVQYLDHRALLPSLVSECKRKIKSAITFLNKKVGDDPMFFNTVLQTLQPWRGVFKKESLQGMVSSTVTPRLARCLSRERLTRDATAQQWAFVDVAFQLNSSELLSDDEFISIMEGELLSRWASVMNDWLYEAPGSVDSTLAENYLAWKMRLLKPVATTTADQRNGETTPASSISGASRPNRLLQTDDVICRIFYSVLLMFKAASASNLSELDDLNPPVTNYRGVLARRVAEARMKARDDIVRMGLTGVADGGGDGHEASVRLHRGGRTPTFREVVEEFAQEKGILFQPRMGTNASFEGKQVFLFGPYSVYLDTNVVFLKEGASESSHQWQPIALDDLATKVNSKA